MQDLFDTFFSHFNTDISYDQSHKQGSNGFTSLMAKRMILIRRFIRYNKRDDGHDIAAGIGQVVDRIGIFDKGETAYPNGDVAQTISALFLVKPIGGHVLTQATDETLKLDYFDFDNLPPLLNQQNADMIHAAQEYLQTHSATK